ncbi:zinc-finger homeodomain protein 12-like [Bidens hawaiensis]|uniref:zinc-finger homeodomain protein 12-like n=1 Tax=Bidens hawaiensis TaxID=980011 RepID=UPI00404A81B2
MDLKHPTTKITNHESETPPHSQIIKLLAYPNGKTHHHHPPPPTYRECLKNHAVSIGGHALDGCGEFMPSPTFTATDPLSFKCAACGCHRNFHRRSPNDFPRHPHPTQPTSASLSPASPPPEHHLLLSLGTVAGDLTQVVAKPRTPAEVKITGRKRFRTKFSQDQKEKMLSFAEKVGWKMPRSDDKMVTDFCNEIGIRRRIFKVWMHNNKNNSTKKEKDTTTTTSISAAATTNAAVAASLDSHHQENGSSSSS